MVGATLSYPRHRVDDLPLRVGHRSRRMDGFKRLGPLEDGNHGARLVGPCDTICRTWLHVPSLDQPRYGIDSRILAVTVLNPP